MLHGDAKWTGRLACAKHVVSYTFRTAFAVRMLWLRFGPHMTWISFAPGQAISAITHYRADRRSTLQALAEKIGSGGLYKLGAPRNGVDENGKPYNDNPSFGTGAYALDQS